MKKTARILSAMLAVCLLAGLLSGCGGKAGSATPTPGGGGMVWVPEFRTLPEAMGSFDCACFSGDTFYAGGMASDAQMSGYDGTSASFSASVDENGVVRGPAIYRVSGGGTECVSLPGYQFAAIPEGLEGSVSVDAICAAQDGTLWVFESAYCYHYELPEGFAGTDQDKGQYYKDDGQRFALRHLAEDGSELLNVDLSSLAGEGSYLYVRGMVCDAAGNVYLGTDSAVVCYDQSGALLFNLPAENGPMVGLTADGEVFASTYKSDYSAQEIKVINTASKSWGAGIEIPTDAYSVYSGSGDAYFLYSTGSALYGYNKEKGESVKLFDWLGCDIDQNAVRTVSMGEDGTVRCADYSYDDGSGELVRLSQKAADTVEEKTTLTLATMSLGSQLRKQVLKFNKTNDAYRIDVHDYSEYNTSADQTAGMTKLNTEIIAGNVPDIIDVSQLPVGQYVSKGLLENLYTFIDADGELSRDSFVQSIMKAMEIDGGLYQATSSFGVFTVIGNSTVVGNQMGWSMDDMMSTLATQPEGTELFQPGIPRSELLQIMCYMYMDKLVDWQTGTCSFDSADFRELLNFCAMFNDNTDQSQENTESEASRITSGKQMLEIITAGSFTDCQMYEAMFGGSVTYKGFPMTEGVGNVAYIDSGLAISSKCADKDGAWSFVRTFLTEAYQESGDVWSFPTNQKAFDQNVLDAMKKEYTTDANGNQVESAKGGIGWDDFYIDIYAVTQQQADGIIALINSVTSTMVYDDSITNIVKEEAAAFFGGGQSVDTAAKNVQSRVSLYVNEQK